MELSSGSGQILVTARRTTPLEVCIDTTRIMLSFLGTPARIRPSFHRKGGRFSSLITTIVPGVTVG